MSKYNEIKAALLGAGTVGGGVYKLIEKRKSEMPSKIQAELTITKVLVKNLNKKREGIPDEVLTDDWQEILDDPEISIVIELMGGIEPARTYILEALKAGKNVVTANKDLLAEHGKELMDAAEEYHKDLYFEAAVGGGIPIIRPLKECLAGNNITEVMGYCQWYNQLYSDQDDAGRHGFWRSTEAGSGAWICRGRSYCRCGRTGRRPQDGDPGIHRIPFQSNL